MDIAQTLDAWELEKMVAILMRLREVGRLYILGLGGSAANASHMAADFRKLVEIDARSLESVAEITARANDEGFSTIFDGFLRALKPEDAIFVLSVGGGTDTVSVPLMRAIDWAKAVGAQILGIVGPDGGYTAKHADCVIKIPSQNPTPYTESFQMVIAHLLCSHPSLQLVPTKW
jgi:D-sedoheptulose 7-phosphate isomerase